MTCNLDNLKGIIQFLSYIINIWTIFKIFSVYNDYINFLVFREFNVFSIENFKFYFKSCTLWRMTKHVSKPGKADSGDRVTLTVKFASKPELTLTRLLGEPKHKGNPLSL